MSNDYKKRYAEGLAGKYYDNLQISSVSFIFEIPWVNTVKKLCGKSVIGENVSSSTV